jgi:hypothetical protein
VAVPHPPRNRLAIEEGLVPPTLEVVTLRSVSLQYDGTNSAAILTLVGAFENPAAYSIGSETGGVLTLTPNPGFTGWCDPIVLNESDHLIMPGHFPCPDVLYADRYVVLS